MGRWGCAKRWPSCRVLNYRPERGKDACCRPGCLNMIRPGWINCFSRAKWCGGGSTRRAAMRTSGRAAAALSRVVPISLLVREDLPGLLPPAAAPPAVPLRSGAAAVLDVLRNRGALFFGELKTLAQLLPSQLEEALRELAALGLVTCDAFAAVRRFVEGQRHTSRHRRRSATAASTAAAMPSGRWSLFPGPVNAAARDEYLEAWCRQLLLRWGVVFRDLLARETSAPSWQELLPTLRLLELRGEVRGGRFVAQVAGEQYALPAAVDQLREARRQLDAGTVGDWIVMSAGRSAQPVRRHHARRPGAGHASQRPGGARRPPVGHAAGRRRRVSRRHSTRPRPGPCAEP